jgi:hypothetical protein
MLPPPTSPTGFTPLAERKSAIRRLLEGWRERRERIKRLNAARFAKPPSKPTDLF